MNELTKPVLRDRDKPLKNRSAEAAEQAVLNAIRAMVRQSQQLADADYTCATTIRQVRLFLKLDQQEMAEKLGVELKRLERWEAEQNPEKVAHTMAFTAKMIDSIYRVLSFAGGGPDSRPEFSLADMLKFLSPEQFEQFVGWIDEGKKRVQVEGPETLQ